MAPGTIAATTSRSVFASGVSTITLASIAGLVPGMVVTDSTTGGNITGGTKIVSINPVNSSIVLSAVTAGASAASPGDLLSFAMTAALAGNPSPGAGLIVVNLQDNYPTLIGASASFSAPLSGSSINISGTTVMTIGSVYVITSLGTSTQANWVAVGVPANITAAVGVSFIATVTGGGTGTGTVQAPVAGGIDHIELVGNPNVMNSNGAYVIGQNSLQANTITYSGQQLIFACYKNTALTAPTTGTLIYLSLEYNDTSIGV